MSVRTRVSIILSLLLIVGSILVTTVNSYIAYQKLRKEAEAGSRLASEKYTREISEFLNIGLGAVRGYRSVLEETRPTRAQIINSLRGFLSRQPGYFGAWAVFEPQAFDGLDEQYRFAKGHDHTGRFIPYINRANSETELTFENCVNYEDEGPIGYYYSVPKKQKREFLTEPTTYLVSKRYILMVSLVEPIIRNSRFAGVVGVDITIDKMQVVIGSIRPFRGTGYLAFLSPDGVFAANGLSPETVGQKIEAEAERQRITQKIYLAEPFIENDASYTHFYYPIYWGNSEKPWAIRASIPNSLYYEDLIYIWAVSLISTFGILGIILFTLRFSFDRYVLRGLSQAMEYSGEIAGGNLQARAEYPRRDEIGALLSAMDKMRDNLSRHMEERIRTQAALRESQEIKRRNELIEFQKKELEAALENLRKAQGQLLQSERMAILGQLSAGLSHELNNPLGAIKASNQTLQDCVPRIRALLPKVHQILSNVSSEIRILYLQFMEACKSGESEIAGMEARRRRKRLSETLQSWGVEPPDPVADTLADMGFTELTDEYRPLFLLSEWNTLLEYTYLEELYFRNSDTIRTSVDRVSKILFALRSYSEGGGKDSLKDISMEETLDTVLTVYQHYIRRGVVIIRSFDEIPPVRCVREDIVQVWTHLVLNALQAINFQGKLYLRLFRKGDEAVVEIEDDGPGIPEEIGDKIFDPFFTTKQEGEGSGLGLDIVKRIVAKYGGRIEWSSKPGKTIFRVFLPFVQKEQPLEDAS
ncbi:hypothetical protein CH373_07970 [Leptospira perolatii]|uniref:histidine kinase n=1 Tax=Leptospira perolatii TaxID=2023191 RepID=A0A2M9ZN29_9LEPT|nr:ATP-binding protein [Leptospira perolatii]PJZ68937.1 hypothetical protein CH360_13745 [Leptospira perolatii]PJZ73445.1 hypothetical protein CH373_07970 [Leptospira perolatii]